MSRQDRPTPSEETMLLWYLVKNFEAVRERAKRDRGRLFQRYLTQQRRIRRHLAWPWSDRNAEEMLEDVARVLDDLHERITFDADLSQPRGEGDDHGSYG